MIFFRATALNSVIYADDFYIERLKNERLSKEGAYFRIKL